MRGMLLPSAGVAILCLAATLWAQQPPAPGVTKFDRGASITMLRQIATLARAIALLGGAITAEQAGTFYRK
jgi:hypothetical protein